MMEKKKKEAIEIERNWADLPPELFPLILKNLPDLCDFVRSRAVCKSWRFSSSVSDLPPQFPWILKLSKGPNLEFYSIALNKVYTIRARCTYGRRFFNPVGPYMLMSQIGNDNSLSLLNPLNNREVPLPVLHHFNPYFFAVNFSWFNPPSFQIDGYIYLYEHKISIRCKPGDDKWDIIGPGHECQYGCYFLKGFLFRVDCQTRVTKIMDISDRREFCVIPPPKYENMPNMYFGGPYLVESCGEILSISYNQSYGKTDYKFYIHRLEFDNEKGKPWWVKLSNIGDRILFFEIRLGYDRVFSLRVSDFSGFKGNCIYFINKVPTLPSGHVHVINMYDIKNGETVFIDTLFDQISEITWFMPTLNHI